MATLNYATRQLDCKIVYYGPALGGKTTNLKQIHDVLPAESCGELTNLATQQDRTLYFDLLPVSLGEIAGYSVKVHLYTVPGQVYYNATRRVVLSGVDGVVMVFDSDANREDANYQSLGNLEENLASYDLSFESIPIVFQYNKRDLPNALTIDFMNKSLNPDGRFEEVEAVALNGDGVQETLKLICSRVFARLEAEIPKRATPSAPARAMRPREASASAPYFSPPAESRETPRAPASPPSIQHRFRRIRQLSDLRHTGVRIGHAILDLEPVSGENEAQDFTAIMEFLPILGAVRREKAHFSRISAAPEAPEIELYECRMAVGGRPSRMWRVPRQGRPTEYYVDWPGAMGKLSIVPEGRRGTPAAADSTV